MRKRQGTELEELVEARFKQYDKTTKRTKNSGALFNDGDIVMQEFLIECKERNTEGFTIKKKVWEQISQQAVMKGKDPLIINRNILGDIFVTMDINTFEWLLEKTLTQGRIINI